MVLKPDTCLGCPLKGYPHPNGFIPASGTSLNGVLIVGEAGGENERIEGIGFIGKSGHFLFSNLQRVGVDRDGYGLANVVACQPFKNLLVKQPFEKAAIAHCAPNLDAAVEAHKAVCLKTGKVPVIWTLGRTAFKRVMGLDEKSPILKKSYLNYPFWSPTYQCWVIAGDHPSFLMRGNTHLIPVLQFGAKRALEIADGTLKPDLIEYLLDPAPSTFAQWVGDYLKWAANHPDLPLSYDIETPHKQGKDEEEVSKEGDDDYTILRCSFSYEPGRAASVPWDASYRPILEEVFGCPHPKVGWNSENYDSPRVKAQMKVAGDEYDAMTMWHVLNSALPKGLGFVVPFYAPNVGMWKHLSSDSPALYNAYDADYALRCYLGIRADLEKTGLWPVYDRHVIQLNRALSYMSGQGVKLDQEMRNEKEKELQVMLDAVEERMESGIPEEVKKVQVYKKTPKKVEGLVQVERVVPVKRCSICNLLAPKADHFKAVSPKRRKLGFDNVCEDATKVESLEPVLLWAKPLDFKISHKSLTSYQKALKHQAIVDRKKERTVFDEPALMKLIKTYTKDPLYPSILEHRELQKLLSTYIGVTDLSGHIRGGMPIGRDGRVHTLFTHNPSTLRLASQNPNLQNLPRPKGADDLATIIRQLIVAGDGSVFLARDYSGIEAVLVGYEASAPAYIRLAKMDVHSYYTAYALNALDGRVKAADLPDIGWDDARLRPHLAAIKVEFKYDRNQLYKHLVHAINYMQGAKGAQAKIFAETGVEYPLKTISTVMGVYKELFPEIPRWHSAVLLQAEKDGFVRNAFGYVHRFSRVFSYEKLGGRWDKRPGPDANKVIAFKPQSNAAGIIKEAILRLYQNRFEEAGQFLRLQVHDECFFEVPEGLVEQVDAIVQEEMEKPVPELRLPLSYGMGEYLRIDTEPKQGKRWGSMK